MFSNNEIVQMSNLFGVN